MIKVFLGFLALVCIGIGIATIVQFARRADEIIEKVSPFWNEHLNSDERNGIRIGAVLFVLCYTLLLGSVLA